MIAPVKIDYHALGDQELVTRLGRRDPHAVRLITQRNNQRLYRAAWSILRNRAEAEDAVQEAYVRAFASSSTFKGESSLSTWLTRIVINEALMRKRAAKRRSAALNPDSVVVMDEYRDKLMGSRERHSSPEVQLMRKQLANVLQKGIAELSEPLRTVLVLREVEGLSVEETAEALEIRPETVKTRTLRAKRHLQAVLDPEFKNALGEAITFAGADCDALTDRVLQRIQSLR